MNGDRVVFPYKLTNGGIFFDAQSSKMYEIPAGAIILPDFVEGGKIYAYEQAIKDFCTEWFPYNSMSGYPQSKIGLDLVNELSEM